MSKRTEEKDVRDHYKVRDFADCWSGLEPSRQHARGLAKEG